MVERGGGVESGRGGLVSEKVRKRVEKLVKWNGERQFKICFEEDGEN